MRGAVPDVQRAVRVMLDQVKAGSSAPRPRTTSWPARGSAGCNPARGRQPDYPSWLAVPAGQNGVPVSHPVSSVASPVTVMAAVAAGILRSSTSRS